MKAYTQEYLLGVRDGREYLNRFRPTLFDQREIVRNLEQTLKGFSGPVAEHLRGERDFWKNQIRKGLK